MVKQAYAIIKQHLPSYLMFYGLFHAVVSTLAVLGRSILPDIFLDIPDFLLFLLLFFSCVVVLLFRGHKEYPAVIFPELGKTEFHLLIVFFFISTVNTVLAWMARGGVLRVHLFLLYCTAANLFASYPLGAYMGRSGRDLCFRRFMQILTWGICAFILFGIIWVFVGNPAAKVSEYFFVYENRLWLNVNPNTLGLNCCLLLIMMPYIFYGLPRGKRVLSSVLTGAVLLMGLLFSDCRGAIMALLAGAALAFGVYLWEKARPLSIPMRLCIVMAGIGVICVILLGGRNLFRQFVVALPGGAIVEKKSLFAPATMATHHSNSTYAVRSLSSQIGTNFMGRSGNARIRIWSCVYQALKNNPEYMLRGCGLAEIPAVLVENGYPSAMYTHNQLLEILLGLGLPALLLFIGWLLLLGRKCFQLGLSQNYSWPQRILPVVILTLLICNMFEAVLLFSYSVLGNVFFLLAGYVFGLMEQGKSTKT